VAQQVLADALATPVAVGESAGEGGAWGMALLAAFAAHRSAESARDRDAAAHRDEGSSASASLSDFLAQEVFATQELTTLQPDESGMAGHATWLEGYRTGLQVERLAGEVLG